jgi:multicomponent K+:H+ antiporter subunit F
MLITLLAAATETTPKAAEVIEAGPAPGELHWLLALVVRIGLYAVTFGLLLCLWRLFKGPRLADRVLAADLFSWHVIGLVVLLTIQLGNLVFFDAVLGIAIVGFASTVFFAQYIGATGRGGETCTGTESPSPQGATP